MKKLLVTGISGFLGSYVLKHPQQEWQIIGTYHQQTHFATPPHLKLDLDDTKAIATLLDTVQPDAIFHLAACSQPNYCALNPEWSTRINLNATQTLGTLAGERGIPMVFTSTDLVFDGEHGPYEEEALAIPINLYGRQKRQAEQVLLYVHPQAAIARMPLMYGMAPHKPGFMGNWLQQFSQGNRIKAFRDEYRTAVSGRDGVAGLFLLLEKGVRGIWHLGGRERLSRYDFACQLTEVFCYPTSLVEESWQADVQMAAARPPDVSLKSTKAYNLGYQPEITLEALRRIRREEGGDFGIMGSENKG